LLNARENIVFLKSPNDFLNNCKTFIGELEQLVMHQPEKKGEILNTAAEICLDLKSFMVNWVLKKHIDKGLLKESDINFGFRKILSFIACHGGEKEVESVNNEVELIKRSNIKKMCDLELEGKLYTYWGHDCCTGLSHSLRRGARFVTTNPAKINLFRKEQPEIWASLVDEIKAKHPNISREEFVSDLFLKVVSISARDLRPIYEASKGKFGFVCVQVNPKNWRDADKMTQEIEFWDKAFKNELNMKDPNIVYKIPAVSAAVKTVDSIVKRGLRVCLTLNFTYSQHDIFSDLIEKGDQNGFVVIMSGFLDDAVDKELISLGIEDSKIYSRHAGEAVIRKSYANLKNKGCSKTSILSAAIRGEWTIKNSITNDADAPMYFTTMTNKIMEFDNENRDLAPIYDDPVPDAVMNVLNKSAIFEEAYQKDLLPIEKFDDYIPLMTVLGNFINAYTEIEESLS